MDETAQADYLVRYYLLALGTGLVERVFWWQLVARGYGLVDPAAPGDPAGRDDPRGPRRRPAFFALKTLLRELDGCHLERVLPAAEPATSLAGRARQCGRRGSSRRLPGRGKSGRCPARRPR